MGSPASSGDGGAFVTTKHAGEEGKSKITVGTRVSGVVRVQAETPGAALDFICEQMVVALHEARGPASVPEEQRTRKDGVYDVTWVSGPTPGSSNLTSPLLSSVILLCDPPL